MNLPNKVYNVGFILDSKESAESDASSRTLARYEVLSTSFSGVVTKTAHVFLLNPEIYGNEKSLPLVKSRRLELILWLKDLACHEVTHYMGYKYHNESFVAAAAESSRLTLGHIQDYLALEHKKNN